MSCRGTASLWGCVAALLAAGVVRPVGGAEGPPAGATERPDSHVVDLRFVEMKYDSIGTLPRDVAVELDEEGLGEADFRTRTGKLLIGLVGDEAFCDRNCDGRIDEADGEGVPVKGREYLKSSRFLKVPVVVGGRRVEYPLKVWLYESRIDRERDIHLYSGAFLQGKLGNAEISVYDVNVNGAFDDVGTDRILVTPGGSRYIEKDLLVSMEGRDLGRMLTIEGELFRPEIVEGGKALRLTPFEGRSATLALEVDDSVSSASLKLSHADGLFSCEVTVGELSPLDLFRFAPRDTGDGKAAADGELLDLAARGTESGRTARKVALPAGDYRVVDVQLDLKRTDVRMASSFDAISLYDMNGTQPLVTVRPGENVLAVGPPLRLEFSAYVWGERGDMLEIVDYFLVGRAGERYEADFLNFGRGSRLPPLRSYVRVGGKFRLLRKLESDCGRAFGASCRLPRKYLGREDVELALVFKGSGIETITAAKKMTELPRRRAPLRSLLAAAKDAETNGRPREAAESYEEAMKLPLEDYRLLSRYARFLVSVKEEGLSDPERAVALARRAHALVADSPGGHSLDMLAEVLYRAGDLDGAVEQAEAAAKVDHCEPIHERAERYRKELEERRSGGARAPGTPSGP